MSYMWYFLDHAGGSCILSQTPKWVISVSWKCNFPNLSFFLTDHIMVLQYLWYLRQLTLRQEFNTYPKHMTSVVDSLLWRECENMTLTNSNQPVIKQSVSLLVMNIYVMCMVVRCVGLTMVAVMMLNQPNIKQTMFLFVMNIFVTCIVVKCLDSTMVTVMMFVLFTFCDSVSLFSWRKLKCHPFTQMLSLKYLVRPLADMKNSIFRASQRHCQHNMHDKALIYQSSYHGNHFFETLNLNKMYYS